MEIGIISSRYPVGPKHDAGRAVYSFAHGLAAIGHSVTVYTYNSSRNTIKHWETKNLKVVSIGVVATMAIKSGLIYEDAEVWNQGIWDEMEHEDTTKLILVFDWFGFAAACQHRSTYGSLVVGMVGTLANGRGHFIPFTDEGKLTDFKEKELEFLTYADYLVAFNKCSASEITKLTDVSFAVIPLGIDESVTEERTSVISGSVLVVGRISREKVLEALLRAISNNYWVELTLCGSGKETDYGTYITKLATKLDVINRINFVQDAPENHYRKSEMVLCPSIYDPFAYQVYDAYNYNVPVIGHYMSYADTIKHRDTGFQYQSMTELSDAMNALHASRSLRKHLVLCAKAEVVEHYTTKRSVERMDNLITLLTDGEHECAK